MRANQMPESSRRSPRPRSALRPAMGRSNASTVSTASHARAAAQPELATVPVAFAQPDDRAVAVLGRLARRHRNAAVVPGKKPHGRLAGETLPPPLDRADAFALQRRERPGEVMLAGVRPRIRPRRAAKQRMTQTQAAALQRARAPAVRIERQERQPACRPRRAPLQNAVLELRNARGAAAYRVSELRRTIPCGAPYVTSSVCTASQFSKRSRCRRSRQSIANSTRRNGSSSSRLRRIVAGDEPIRKRNLEPAVDDRRALRSRRAHAPLVGRVDIPRLPLFWPVAIQRQHVGLRDRVASAARCELDDRSARKNVRAQDAVVEIESSLVFDRHAPGGRARSARGARQHRARRRERAVAEFERPSILGARVFVTSAIDVPGSTS